MVRGRRLRSAYNAVSAQEEDDDNNGEVTEVFEDEEANDNNNNNNNSEEGDVEAPPQQQSRLVSGGRNRRQYQTVSTTGSGEDADEAAREPPTKEQDNQDDDDDDKTVTEDDDEEQDGTAVTLVILDPAQKKFEVPAFTNWSIAKFKQKGQRVHKVAPSSQRLIYRGRLLQDDMTLEEAGLNENHLILHLFPKPRVVIQQSSACSAAGSTGTGEEGNAGNANGEDSNGGGGAHVPQIILNADEAEQRATILVLGSTDFLEAQNNVKLFSFLLMVISSIELFNLILILMGVPQQPQNGGNNPYSNGSEDDYFHIDTNATDASGYNNYNNDNENLQVVDPYEQTQIQEEMQSWHPRNNVDFVISALGVYVALLGIRATNETTLRIAKQYLVGTVVVGISWMLYNYWFTVHVDQEFDQMRRDEKHNHTFAPIDYTNSSADPDSYGPSNTHYDDDAIPYKTDMDYYSQNLSLMMIPGMVWILCCVRAWQFQSLLEEAEQEAEERIRNELEQHRVTVTEAVNGNANDDEQDDAEQARPPRSTARGSRRGRASNRRNDDEMDLELQNSSAVLS